MKRHIYDANTAVCSCGRTKEQHLNIELVNEKMKEKWFLGNMEMEKDFQEIDEALAINPTPN